MTTLRTPQEQEMDKELLALDEKYKDFLADKPPLKNLTGNYWKAYQADGRTRLKFEDDIPEDMKADVIAIFDKYIPRKN